MKVVVTSLTSGDLYQLEVEPDLSLLEFMRRLAIESKVPVEQQLLSLNGRLLSDQSVSLRSIGIKSDDLLILNRQLQTSQSSQAAPSIGSGSASNADRAEKLRASLLADRSSMAQLEATNPSLAKAARENPQEFRELILRLEKERFDVQQKYLRDMVALEDADPFDIEAQKRIEDAIRMQQIEQNMQMAIEHNPEVFARVTMLYVPIEVNKHPVKAFVDSGAQSTIMSPELAARCGLAQLIDKRFAGIAMGVGTAKILGRIHNAHLKIGTQYLPCSFIVMENKGVEFLFGLDMLKRYQASIDLKKNCLLINDESVAFLPEHEIPKSEEASELVSPSKQSESKGKEAKGNPSVPTESGKPVAFLDSKENVSKIEALVQLGATKDEAIQALLATNGDVEAAASFFFS